MKVNYTLYIGQYDWSQDNKIFEAFSYKPSADDFILHDKIECTQEFTPISGVEGAAQVISSLQNKKEKMIADMQVNIESIDNEIQRRMALTLGDG